MISKALLMSEIARICLNRRFSITRARNVSECRVYLKRKQLGLCQRSFGKWSRKIELRVVFHIAGTAWLFTRNLFDSHELMNIYLTRVARAACKRIVVLFFFFSLDSPSNNLPFLFPRMAFRSFLLPAICQFSVAWHFQNRWQQRFDPATAGIVRSFLRRTMKIGRIRTAPPGY